jgi:catechol-2,3-dioxygenase
MTTAMEASSYLHHLHLGSPDPAGLAAFYAETMDMPAPVRDGEALALAGSQRRLMISSGAARQLHHAGFAVRDAEALGKLRARAAAEGLAPRDAGSSFFQPGAFSVTDPDGNTILFGLAKPDQPTAGRPFHGPLQHLTLATRDVGAIEAFYAGKLGFGVSDRVLREDGKVMTSFMRGNHEHHNLACFHQDRAGMDHHSYEAGSWDAIKLWCDHFASRDIQLMWGPGRHGPGNNLFVFITDPDGNWIEVSAELEVIHDRPLKQWPHAERTLNLWGRGLLRA